VIKNDQTIKTQQFHCLKQDTQAVKICYYNTYVTEYIKKKSLLQGVGWRILQG